MKRYDPRLWLGGALVLLGALSLLANLEIISDVGDIFWGVIWVGVGVYFLQRLFARGEWWAAFPGCALVGLGLSGLLPDAIDYLGGLMFFGGLAVAFLWVYITDRTRWWAIIPTGVMLTLGVIAVMDEFADGNSGSLLFLGLGLTFLLVTILPGGSTRTWALIPGTILLLFGAMLGTPLVGFMNLLFPGLLIILGGYLLVRFFGRRSTE
jgi:hypothetical protein